MTLLVIAAAALTLAGYPLARWLHRPEPAPAPDPVADDVAYGRRIAQPGYHAGGRR